MNENRGSLYLLTGLVIGVALGLLFVRYVLPGSPANLPGVSEPGISPAQLAPEYKDAYRALIAAAYRSNGDLLRARARLDLLKDEDPYAALAEQAQRTLAEEPGSQQAQALGQLALALGQQPQELPAPIASQALEVDVATATNQPSATPSPSPTLTSSPSPSPLPPSETSAEETALADTAPAAVTPTPPNLAAFRLADSQLVCNPPLAQPMLLVQVEDEQGDGVPYSEVAVTWQGGEEHFYTGLKPELGQGYADFELEPEQSYSVRLVDSDAAAATITPEACPDASGTERWGAWLLTYRPLGE